LIYIDSSVAIAQLLGEARIPPPELWRQPLVASRLLEYELWTRINARGLEGSHGDAIRALLSQIDILELSPTVLVRALEPFPLPLRTLDALHLASLEYLRALDPSVALASYDNRMLEAARAMGVPIASI